MKLRVNPIACTGHGICAELLPELHQAGPVGLPPARQRDGAARAASHARRAAAACPTLALLTDDSLVPDPAARGGRRHAG